MLLAVHNIFAGQRKAIADQIRAFLQICCMGMKCPQFGVLHPIWEALFAFWLTKSFTRSPRDKRSVVWCDEIAYNSQLEIK